MSELLALGVSHRTAPVALRERLSLTEVRGAEFRAELLSEREIHEAVTISTCNRTEVYLVVGDPVEAETIALGMLAREAGIRPTELVDAMYTQRNCDVARHLYRVTAGLESMIVGEAEVQGQVKRSYERALASGTTGPLTNRLFHAALLTGKRVRTETGIGTGGASVPSVAVELARQTLGEIRNRRVVLLGAGETSELTARALADQGVDTLFVANRRLAGARTLAEQFGGRALSFDGLPGALAEADIVVSSTSSPHPILTHAELAEVMASRGERPLLVIDIAVPRDVEPSCKEIDGVTVLDIDDLQAVVRRNHAVRRGEARRAQAIIEEEIQRFAAWLGSLEVLPTITALRARGDAIVEQVLAENATRWESLSEADRERVVLVARAVAQRLLHEPTVRVKRADDRVHARMQVLRELFALEDADDASAPSDASAPGGRRAEVRELPRRGSERAADGRRT